MSACLVSTPMPAPTRRSGVGVLFLGGFGTLWLLLGCRGLIGTGGLLLPPALLGGAILFAGWRLTKNESLPDPILEPFEEQRRARGFRNINLAQWGAIVVMIVLLNVIGRIGWITPTILFVVGIHFIPLAFLFKNRAHLFIGSALALLALLYPLLTLEGPASPVGPLAAGIILLGGAAHVLLKSHLAARA